MKRLGSALKKHRGIFFLDRDGVLIKEVERGDRVGSAREIDEIEFIHNVKPAIRLIHDMNMIPVMVTNQPDISRGFVTYEQMSKLNNYIASELSIARVYMCPHDETDKCTCRKPKVGLFLQALDEFKIQFESKYVVGDRLSDMESASAIKAIGFWVVPESSKRANSYEYLAVPSLFDAVKIVWKGNK